MRVRPLVATLVLSLTASLAVAPIARASGPQAMPADWVPSNSGVRSSVVSAIKGWTVDLGGPKRAAKCFSVEVLRERPSLALAGFAETVAMSCSPSDGFGVMVLKKINGSWKPAAQISGGAGARCEYYIRMSKAEKALLKKFGPC